MKKFLCVMMSAIMIVGIFSSLPMSSFAATQKVKLKKSSATLKIKKKNGKTVYGSTTIKIKKAKGVKIKKITYKSSSKKITKVTLKGKVKAKKKGSAKITVKIKYTYKKKTYKKSLIFNVTVKDLRNAATTASTTAPTEPASTEAAQPTNATEATAPTQQTEPSPQTSKLNEVNTPVNSSTNFADKDFLKRLSKFSNKLYHMSSANENGNYTMSPVSIYMAFSMLYYIGDEGVKTDLEELTGMQNGDFAKTGELFKYLSRNTKYNGETVSQLNLTNSIWINNGTQTNQNVLDSLASDYFCNAFETPFRQNNPVANRAIREFIKEQTNGMIDQDFNIPADTLFALINTLYFKDVWSIDFKELSTEQKAFKTADKSSACEFLIGQYVDGQTQETNNCNYFYTTTESGYKLKLILPKDGHTLKEVMTADNLDKINNDTEFDATDKDGTKHYTRCIFPSFKVENNTPLKDILENNNYLPNAFNLYTSPLFATELQVSDIIHRTVVDVSKTGIEGAAVTMILNKEGFIYDPDPKKYHDFVLDKNFGFIITDQSDVVLFEGQVTNP